MNTLILLTDIVEKLILISLFALSIWSVSIMIDRRRYFQSQARDWDKIRSQIQSQKWKEILDWAKADGGFVAGALVAALGDCRSEGIDRSVSSYLKKERPLLEKGFGVLATLGSNAPFIGLFGTVLGIIRSFAYLGSQSGSAAVMSGVSQALYATAMGLFVAIPAVVAFNYFSKKSKDLILTIESLRDLYISELIKSGEKSGKS